MGWSWPANRRVLYNRACATWTASLGILRENKSGGTKANKNGWQRRTRFKVDSKPKDHMGPFIMNPEA